MELKVYKLWPFHGQLQQFVSLPQRRLLPNQRRILARLAARAADQHTLHPQPCHDLVSFSLSILLDAAKRCLPAASIQPKLVWHSRLAPRTWLCFSSSRNKPKKSSFSSASPHAFLLSRSCSGMILTFLSRRTTWLRFTMSNWTNRKLSRLRRFQSQVWRNRARHTWTKWPAPSST